MKNVKFMLLSLILFSVIGGVLAFKAKVFAYNFCVGTTVDNTDRTVASYSSAYKFTVMPSAPLLYYRTTDDHGNPITNSFDCEYLTSSYSARITPQ